MGAQLCGCPFHTPPYIPPMVRVGANHPSIIKFKQSSTSCMGVHSGVVVVVPTVVGTVVGSVVGFVVVLLVGPFTSTIESPECAVATVLPVQ